MTTAATRRPDSRARPTTHPGAQPGAGTPSPRAVAADVISESSCLWARVGEPPRMEAMHSHNDLELNIVVRGELHYLFAGRPWVLRAGQVALFWAIPPHGLVESLPGSACWVHVPLPTVLGWGLPEDDLARLLRPEPVVVDSPTLHARLAGLVGGWCEDFDDEDDREPAVLEIQAAVRRLLSAAGRPPSRPTHLTGQASRLDQVTQLARFVMEHHRSPLTVDEIAASAHLSASHAMAIFRAAVGVTIGEYLTMCRVSEAERLLVTTDRPVAEIAHASGFGSLSSFHVHLGRATGCSPREFRRRSR
ncbi:helix-turn-helix domain-containing protein [Aestuariimicrobium kwangyangense]|uniref:helix-turn-helix domain-containing protein n=1 Tax=Aestuariimicrobium kwangyangense TaxID=396389 RepID=UPI0003B7337B|nr:helix-turn-helix domain-containing protein [Aestuariimicrobium kwangyangense]